MRPTYRNRGGFIVADLAVRDLRKIKDTTGRPIWSDSVREGEQTTLLGKRVLVEPNMAAPGSSTKPMAFGDPSTYLIREVNGVRVVRLGERYLADEHKIGYLGWRRIDGKLLDTSGIKTLQMAA